MTPQAPATHPVKLTDPYLEDFHNTPLLDFADPTNRRAMQAALESVRAQLGATYPLVIGDREIADGDTFASINPADPEEVIGRFPVATGEHVEAAMEAALAAFESWGRRPAAERAAITFRAGELLGERRLELAAWMVLEVGKNCVEADADVAEAIDFYNFYALQMLRLDAPQPLVERPDEEVELRYIPLGVGVVIPPWNFPCAIPAGMSTAAIVAGNTVVLKPSSDAPVIGYQFQKVWKEVGLPAGVCNFLPGRGSIVGDGLVQHPKTRFIAFTGSRQVGVRISEEAGRVHDGQIWLKRTILEMGGKDAIIVDAEADLEAAVEGVAVAAYGYQGQKCSACSRAIVDESIYEEFLERLVARTAAIKVGPPENPDNWMGPVINEAAYRSILEYLEIGKQEGRLLTGGGRAEGAGAGYFLQPTIVADVEPDARLAQEEVFGPLLAVIKARDFDDALRIANNTEYGLTGAIYSNNPDKIRQAKERFHVGNLYINRKCTGAIVGSHPFGGFNMSGTDSKAGGRDYLLLFTQAKSIAEKVR
ncbi:MAG: L-glutamate gamma-semialdehyde dehydrogenase [Acidobacteriota bacterium]